MGEIRHAVQRTGSVVGVLAIFALICFGGWSIYVSFVKPHTNPTATTRQSAKRIVNYHINIHKEACLIDFKLLGIRLSTFCRDKNTKEIISQEEKRKVDNDLD